MIYRYKRYSEVSTRIDPLEDLASQLLFFRSEDFTVNLLHSHHGITKTDAKHKHKKISAHANAAFQYVEASVQGPKEVSFLPLYYAVLNITKLYILLAHPFPKLRSNRRHGASYEAHGKDSHSLLTDRIILRSNGVIPLFYKTITNTSLPDNYSIDMREIYPFLLDINYEWSLATDEALPFALVGFSIDRNDSGLIRLRAHINSSEGGDAINARQLHLIRDMRRRPNRPHQYIAKYEGTTGRSISDYVNTKINRFMIYGRIRDKRIFSPISGKQVMMFEELPILLSYFHIGSVCRYKPDFFDKILNSKFGPVVISARTNLLLRYLTLFWSFAQQTHFNVRRS